MVKKMCTKCRKIKTLDLFYKSGKSRDGHHYYCKQCMLEYMWEKRSKEC